MFLQYFSYVKRKIKSYCRAACSIAYLSIFEQQVLSDAYISFHICTGSPQRRFSEIQVYVIRNLE